METQVPALMRNEPYISEYLEALLRGGKTKEVKDTKELLDYLDSMEQKFSELINEVASLKETIQTLQNPETHSHLSTITDKLEHLVKNTKEMIRDTKESFLVSVNQALDKFKKEGKSAAIKTIETLRFKEALNNIGRSLIYIRGGVEAFNVKLNEITEESQVIKNNFRNIGRIIVGKEKQPYHNDKIKLNVLQRIGNSLSHKIETLYNKTRYVCKKLDEFDKTSVKKDLQQISINKSSETKSLEKLISNNKSR